MSILCYHAVDPAWRSPLAISPDVFAQQCAWLGRHRRVASLTEVVGGMNGSARLPRGVSVLTFDDGFAGVHTHAFPLLLRHRLPATMFLVAQTLTAAGRPVDWVDDPPPDPAQEGEGTATSPLRTLTKDQVLEMQAAGINFGSHSYAHHDLTTLSEGECERDLRASREALEDLLARPVRLLAYPRGRHNERVRRSAARAGFSYAFSLPEGPEPNGPHAIPRVGVWAHDRPASLRLKTADWYVRVRTSRVYRFTRAAQWRRRFTG